MTVDSRQEEELVLQPLSMCKYACVHSAQEVIWGRAASRAMRTFPACFLTSTPPHTSMASAVGLPRQLSRERAEGKLASCIPFFTDLILTLQSHELICKV